MDLENIMLSEMSHRERQVTCGFTYMWNRTHTNKTEQNKNRNRDQRDGFQRGGGWVEDVKENTVRNIVKSLHSDR